MECKCYRRAAAWVSWVAMLLLGGCATRTVPIIGRTQTMSGSDARLNAESAHLYAQIVAHKKGNVVPTAEQRVARVSQRLVTAMVAYFAEIGDTARLSEFDWEFTVIEDSDVNAGCFPGGKVTINTGMLAAANSDDQLAAIIGHEMAHALAHHTSEKMADRNAIKTMTGVLTTTGSGQMGQKFGEQYGELASKGFLLPHSRYQEAEADHMGLILMSLAGYEPHAAGDFWRGMMEEFGSGRREAYRQTHPANEDRMRQLDALVPTVMPIYEKARNQAAP